MFEKEKVSVIDLLLFIMPRREISLTGVLSTACGNGKQAEGEAAERRARKKSERREERFEH